ncbi:TraR/DksA family transcriptional regulator [Piscinibacter sp.]|uniref:TraR/DksA family transcriptional regulator n=1 Tax=Piscinibacter sp. TaxID=1903157 RepID=UPI002B5BF216|nr:TraR/DksA family transcriptional regulator [Albitalea sp.]HUG25249.1 TraR/DksA family transcriptional regulator [Albitalea sp.]
MSAHDTPLSPTFIAAQGARLTLMREELIASGGAAIREETELQQDSLHESQGSGDDAQKTTMQDNDAALFVRNRQRLVAIDRALQKIEEGTYGVSDESGEPIPQARLEAVPESLCTVAEESVREQQDA